MASLMISPTLSRKRYAQRKDHQSIIKKIISRFNEANSIIQFAKASSKDFKNNQNLQKKPSSLNVNKKKGHYSRVSKRKLIISPSVSKNTHNLRYQEISLDESERDLNKISTPQEDENTHNSLSPFSDIIEDKLSVYINPALADKLPIPKNAKIKEIKHFSVNSAPDFRVQSNSNKLILKKAKKQLKHKNKSFYDLLPVFPKFH